MKMNGGNRNIKNSVQHTAIAHSSPAHFGRADSRLDSLVLSDGQSQRKSATAPCGQPLYTIYGFCIIFIILLLI